MNVKQDIEKTYNGYEMGPIRPPSEARSLLLRVTRNCHWNRCGFCPVYKQVEFSTRPKSHVIQDIDSISSYIELIQEAGSLEQFFANQGKLNVTDPLAYRFALRWFNQGMKSFRNISIISVSVFIKR